MRYSLHKQASASLKSGLDLKEIVKLPDDEDEDDWIAVHGETRRNILFITKSDFGKPILVVFIYSGRFFQSNQSCLWHYQ